MDSEVSEMWVAIDVADSEALIFDLRRSPPQNFQSVIFYRYERFSHCEKRRSYRYEFHFQLLESTYCRCKNVLFDCLDENGYEEGVKPTVEFAMTHKDITGTGAPSTLLVFNIEVGFCRENVELICSIGCSTKKKNTQRRLIGERDSVF